ncbi:MAG: glycosyltransferase family 2 protein [bacterium]|nr:glycosyltransferase family 2 protein [bacterium]
MVSAIIPALNEASTIGEVISVVLGHPDISEVIVVDDGSTDGTADIARKAGAIVIVNNTNLGKAMAMDRGVRAARSEIILFLDADVLGYTHEALSYIIDPVKRGEYEMFVGIRSRKTLWLNRILHFFPIISGERVITKDLWLSLPADYMRGFMIETVLNYAAKKTPKGMGFRLTTGTRHIIKEKKYGILKGLVARLRMIWQVSVVSFQLYIIGGIAEAFQGLRRKS